MGKAVIVGGTSGLGNAISEFLKPEWQVEAISRRTGFNIMAGDLPECDAVVFSLRVRDEHQYNLEVEVEDVAACLETLPSSCRAVVLISSVAAKTVATEQPWEYHAAKAALESLTRYFAVKLAPFVRVNAVAPGLVDKDDPKWREQNIFMQKHLPMPLTRPNDVAEVVRWLLEPNCPLTGQTLTVDAGASLLNVESLLAQIFQEQPNFTDFIKRKSFIQ